MLSAETGPLRQTGKDGGAGDAGADRPLSADAGGSEGDAAAPEVAPDAGNCGCATGRKSTELGVCCTPATECPSGYALMRHADCEGETFDTCVDTYGGGCL
jgi:hypothetical protein